MLLSEQLELADSAPLDDPESVAPLNIASRITKTAAIISGSPSWVAHPRALCTRTSERRL
jgi:hypothetical protein